MILTKVSQHFISYFPLTRALKLCRCPLWSKSLAFVSNISTLRVSLLCGDTETLPLFGNLFCDFYFYSTKNMNIKKMFTALSAMVVAVTMTLPSASVFGAEYSQELQDAYNWAHDKGVTTMDSIDNANMYGAITRAEMAKMLSVYATKVLNPAKEADTSAACTFTDIDSVKGDLHDYIIESCQLGIMGQNMPNNAFRPYDTISRAEFGTALSRVLWGDQYNGGTPYYANHLNALKANAIMNQIANAESTKEIRGYVMLMLMRSEL
jgi:hypothetical protein